MKKIYVIEGAPIALKRPHTSFKTRHIYNPLSQALLVAGLSIKNQHGDQPLLEGPLLMTVNFYMPIPSSKSKKHQRKEGDPHIITPDLSNLLKFAEDVCNAVVYKDDCIIATVIGSKTYSSNPRTEFWFTQLNKEIAS